MKVNEDILFQYIIKFTKNNFQKKVLKLNEKKIKQELHLHIPKFNYIITNLQITLEDIFKIYHMYNTTFNYQDFLKNWQLIILNHFSKQKRIAKLFFKLYQENKLDKLTDDYLKHLIKLIGG